MEQQQHVKLGEPVPHFTLPASNGRKVSLSDFRGNKVLLYFYPADLTPGCTTEACDFRDLHPNFRKLGIKVIGISPDDREKHKRFIAQHELPFLLLTDDKLEVIKLFDTWQEKKLYGRAYMGIERSTFLIDEHGVLVREWRRVQAKGHAERIRKDIAGENAKAGKRGAAQGKAGKAAKADKEDAKADKEDAKADKDANVRQK